MSRIDELLEKRKTDSCINLRFAIGDLRIVGVEQKDYLWDLVADFHNNYLPKNWDKIQQNSQP